MSDQIDVNALADALNEKMDLPDGKSQSGVDFVIDWKVPTSSDPSWYRVYKSGWVEQGGYFTPTATASNLVTLPKTMADTNYCVMSKIDLLDTGNMALSQSLVVSTTQININVKKCNADTYYAYKTFWEVKGMGA